MQRKVLTADLQLGMYVAKLDRPWSDTPFLTFLTQGFLLNDPDQLQQIRETCEWVMIDPEFDLAQSEPKSPVVNALQNDDALAALDNLLQDKAALPAHFAAENKPGMWRNIREGFKDLVAGKTTAVDTTPTPEKIRPAFIAPDIALSDYDDSNTVEQELNLANAIFTDTLALLNRITSEIAAGQPLTLSELNRVVDALVQSMVRNADAMLWVARKRESEMGTHGHGINVAIYLTALARHVGLPLASLTQLAMIGLTLDLGKIRLPTALLEKNARLTSNEFEQIKDHVEYSVNILNESGSHDAAVIEGVAQHHERINGTGYPFNLMGDEISLFGRMAAIADTFTAITKARPYAEPVSSHEALQMLSDWGGSQFDAAMVEQFIQSIGVFPVGSLVELSSNEVAIVITHHKIKRLRPRVLIIAGVNKASSTTPLMVDLLADVTDSPMYIRRGLPDGAHGLHAAAYSLPT